MNKQNHFLMCAPDYYEVSYVINPWMEGNLNNSAIDLVTEQWQKLHSLINENACVELINPIYGLPDMVFTANAGLIRDDVVVLSRFLHKQRQGEEAYFQIQAWFNQKEKALIVSLKDER